MVIKKLAIEINMAKIYLFINLFFNFYFFFNLIRKLNTFNNVNQELHFKIRKYVNT